MANLITGIRIIFSLALLFCPVFSPAFYSLYLISGISDMVDGVVARKLGTVSDFGSKLDTVADFVFFLVCLIKLFPVLHLPSWMLIWVFVIALIKLVNLIFGYIKHRKMIASHTFLNKLTGFLLFIFPLTAELVEFKYSSVLICFLATVAAVEEGIFILRENGILI